MAGRVYTGPMQRRVFVVGAGTTKFERPHSRKWDYPEMGREAAEAALKDAGIEYTQVQAVVASYCYGDPTCGQKAVYGLGLTGVPVFNVNNNCSSGSTALMMARLMVQGGYDCTLAVGSGSQRLPTSTSCTLPHPCRKWKSSASCTRSFEKMNSGLSENFPDRVSPMQEHVQSLEKLGAKPGPLNPHVNAVTSDVVKMFAYAARDHCRQYGTTVEQFAKITSKNRRHGTQNPKAATQKAITPDQVLSKRKICDPITIAMSAPTGDGGAATIVCSEDFVRRHQLQDHAVEIVAQHMVTDIPQSYSTFLGLCGYFMSKEAVRRCMKEAGMSADDVDVVELHDCFAPNELFLYEALGLCPEGKGGSLIDSAEWIRNSNGGEVCRLGGRWVVNPSGGLESKGHPIGATGLAQCAELQWQLRGVAGKRQVENAKVGLQQNFGIGGAAVVTLYKKYSPEANIQTLRARL